MGVVLSFCFIFCTCSVYLLYASNAPLVRRLYLSYRRRKTSGYGTARPTDGHNGTDGVRRYLTRIAQ